jgi:hypothetical protein
VAQAGRVQQRRGQRRNWQGHRLKVSPDEEVVVWP